MSKTNQKSMDELFEGLTMTSSNSSKVSKKISVKKDNQVEETANGKREAFLARIPTVHLNKMRVISGMNGLHVSDCINIAIVNFINDYEKEHGRVPQPSRDLTRLV